jgi:hypothetical protein
MYMVKLAGIMINNIIIHLSLYNKIVMMLREIMVKQCADRRKRAGFRQLVNLSVIVPLSSFLREMLI